MDGGPFVENFDFLFLKLHHHRGVNNLRLHFRTLGHLARLLISNILRALKRSRVIWTALRLKLIVRPFELLKGGISDRLGHPLEIVDLGACAGECPVEAFSFRVNFCLFLLRRYWRKGVPFILTKQTPF